ncbi:MAG: hypothetical protein LBQ33_07030 [Oscillospiraceae bacterium]|jgi:hypothetical protein|nr:hypothetical protein [Oscillospiraceae bacterium]
MMNRKWKRTLAVLLSVCLLFGSMIAPSAAEGQAAPDDTTAFFYDLGDKLLKGLLTGITALIPSLPMPSSYTQSQDFYPGMDAFQTEPDSDAQWLLGYASGSLLTENVLDGKHYVSGGLVGAGQTVLIDKKTPTEIIDDQRVRVTALSDDSGNGTVLLISLDAFGITSKDVRRIREQLRTFAKANNIVSINVSALHQHSVIDTLGMNGPLLEALFLNPFGNITGLYAPYSGKNAGFMENLYKVTAETAKAAVRGMEPGALTYAKTDISEYIRDKRAPEVFDGDMHRLRFVPLSGGEDAKETWLVNLAIHCTGNGVENREITGDFPYYMEKAVNEEAGANFQLIQGAQLAITLDTAPVQVEGASQFENMVAYGTALGQKLAEIPAEDEEAVAPILNVRHKEYTVPVENPLHRLFFRLKMLDATAVQKDWLGLELELVTEIGYLELGEQLAVAIIPGELEPALAFGGGLDAAQSWTGEAFSFTSMQETVGGERELLVFGLTNDQTGYILLPNDVHSFILFGNEELNAVSSQAAPRALAAFEALAGK